MQPQESFGLCFRERYHNVIAILQSSRVEGKAHISSHELEALPGPEQRAKGDPEHYGKSYVFDPEPSLVRKPHCESERCQAAHDSEGHGT